MAKSTFVHTRIEPNLKVTAEALLDEMGISPAQAIRMFYKKIITEHGLPFELKVPNKTTEAIMKKTDAGKALVKSKDLDDLFDNLDI